MEKNVAVLDIGSGKLVFAVGRKTGKGIYIVDNYACRRVPVYCQGQWIDVETLALDLEQVVAKSGYNGKIRTVYVGVPSEFVKLESSAPILKFDRERLITDEVIDEIQTQGDCFSDRGGYRTISSAARGYTLDERTRTLYPVGERARVLRADMTYVLCRKDFCETADKLLARFGFDTVKFISQSWAQGSQLLDSDLRESGCCVADVGFLSTSFFRVKGDGLEYLTTAPLGCGCIADDLSVALDISIESALAFLPRINLARELRDGDMYEVADGTNVYRYDAGEVNALVQDRLRQLAGFFERCIRESRAKDAPAGNERIFLTGGGIPLIRGAVGSIETHLGRQVIVLVADVPRYDRAADTSFTALLNVASEIKASKSFWNKLFG